MTEKQDIKLIEEGETEVLVFKQKSSKKGPGSKHKEPFYNPAMELNRDLSVLINQWFVKSCKKHVHLLDGLAASGIRGVRWACEIQGDFEVTINDWNEQAFSLIKKNISHKELKNVTATNMNLNALLSENCYHYIDIDPFGSPVYFVDSAMRSIYNNGIIACTATDTATLCGVYPKVCLRRYSAKPYHSFMMHETGLRILLGVLCRMTARYDKGIEPIVSYSDDHYFRVYAKVRKGKSYANNSIKNLCHINSNKLTVSSDGRITDVGSLWMGKLHNKNIVRELRTILFEKHLNTKHTLWKLLDLFEEEADAPAFFYTTDDLASFLHMSPPKIENIFDRIKKKGYDIVRTHFNPTGFKTNAPLAKIKEVFKEDKT